MYNVTYETTMDAYLAQYWNLQLCPTKHEMQLFCTMTWPDKELTAARNTLRTLQDNDFCCAVCSFEFQSLPG